MGELDRRLKELEVQQGELQRQINELRGLVDHRVDEPAAPAPEKARWEPEFFDDPDPMRRPLSPRRERRSLDDLATPRNLAAVGGTGVTIGLAFLVSYGISQGWISESVRVVVAAIASVALALGGAWLLERRQQGAPAMAMLLSGLVGAYLTLLAATRLYELIGTDLGVVLAAITGALALASALRWNSEEAAVLAGLGALLAPALVGADYTGATLAFLVPVFAVAMFASALRDWGALFAVALVTTLASVAAVEFSDPLHPTTALLLTIALSLLTGGGLLMRTFATGESSAWKPALYGLAAAALAGVGFAVIGDAASSYDSPDTAQDTWLFVFAALNLGCVLRAHALGLIDLRRAALTASTAAFAWGLGEVLHGPALVIAWSAAAIVTLIAAREDWEILIAAGFAGLAVGHVILIEIPPDALGNGVDSLGDAWIAGVSLIVIAVSSWSYGLYAGNRIAPLVAVGLAIYLLSVTIVDVSVNDVAGAFTPIDTSALDSEAKGQVAVSCLWAISGLGFVLAGLRLRISSWRSAGLGLLALAGAKIVAFDLSSLSVAARTISFIVVGLVFLLAAFAYQVARRSVASQSD